MVKNGYLIDISDLTIMYLMYCKDNAGYNLKGREPILPCPQCSSFHEGDVPFADSVALAASDATAKPVCTAEFPAPVFVTASVPQ